MTFLVTQKSSEMRLDAFGVNLYYTGQIRTAGEQNGRRGFPMDKRAQLLDRIAQSTWTLHIKGLEYQVIELDFGVE